MKANEIRYYTRAVINSFAGRVERTKVDVFLPETSQDGDKTMAAFFLNFFGSRFPSDDIHANYKIFVSQYVRSGESVKLLQSDAEAVLAFSDHFRELDKLSSCARVVQQGPDDRRAFVFIDSTATNDARYSCLYFSIRSAFGFPENYLQKFHDMLILDGIILSCVAKEWFDGTPSAKEKAIFQALNGRCF